MKVNLWFILFLIAFSLLMIREFIRPGSVPPESDTVFITEIIPGDSIPFPVEIEKKVPVPVYKDTGSTFWKYHDVDTMAIFRDYFAKYYYDDILMDDSSAFIRLMAHTSENRLFYDSLLFQNRRITSINSTIIPPTVRKGKLYLGIGNGFKPGEFDFTGDILYTTPRNFAFAYKRGITSRWNYLTIYYAISFRRGKKKEPD